MDKTSEKVTNDPKPVEAACRGKEKYMNKLKESILNDAKKGSRDTSNATNETTSSGITATIPATSNATTRLNDAYVYGVGMLAVLAIGVCVFFAYNTFQSKNKKLINEKQDQPPNDVICFRKIYNK